LGAAINSKIVSALVDRCQARGVVEPSLLDKRVPTRPWNVFPKTTGARSIHRYLEKMGIEILDEDIDPELYRNIPMVITVGCPVWKEFGCVIGQTFRFPRRYKDMVQPGRPFVYYQCTSLRDGGEKLRGYFGTGIIGEVDKDRRGKNKFTGSKYTASIRDYRPFERIVYWTDGKFPIEGDLEDRDWLELVRDISKDTFARILRYEQNPVITEPPLIGSA
jgi:hypothetical protein